MSMRVFLLHGWPVDETMWDRQVDAVREAGFAPLAPRLYGRGPSIDGWAAQLLREHDGPFVTVGASMGGYLALALARRAPERIVGMVLVASRAEADTIERRKSRSEMISSLRTSGLSPDAETTIPADLLADAQEAMRDRMDLTGIVSSFGGPVLVCVGDGDEIVSVDESRALAARALQGSLEVFEGAGHFPNLEQPERFDDVLVEFLAQWRT